MNFVLKMDLDLFKPEF